MKCKDCKWWEILEDDEKERKNIQKDINKVQKEIGDFRLSKSINELFDNKPLMKKYNTMLNDENLLLAGWCHRYPPIRQLEDPEENEIGYAWFGTLPKTPKYEYCGEFKGK